jgi:quercetin 2,3-dioxygenase
MEAGMQRPERVEVRRADERFHTQIGWLDSWHSFSFGQHHDPRNTGHGLLIVSNDDLVAPASGFGMHHHRDMEIVTWVVVGALEHRDSEGNVGVIRPGHAQRMSAGTGIFHSEMNPSPDEPVRLVQMWVLPDRHGLAPSYEQRDVSEALAGGGLVVVASGQGHDGAVSLNQRDAVLHAARLPAGAEAEVPAAPHVHVFVARGTASLDGAGHLVEGDAVRLTRAGSRPVVAGSQGAELLVWATA